MREYRYSNIRKYSLLVIIYALAIAVVMLTAMTGITALFVGSIIFAGAVLLCVTIYRLDRLRKYKAVVGELTLTVHVPDGRSTEVTEIAWGDIRNITCESRGFLAKIIGVNAKDESAVFPLHAFAKYKLLLKTIIKRSCDNPGFYTDQEVLVILKN